MRKAAMLATVAAALAALAIPASASAIWQDWNGFQKANLPAHAQIQYTGQFGYVSGNLGKHCLIDSKVTLLASQTTAAVTQFEPDLTAEGSTVTQVCEPSAGLKALGCTDAHSLTVEGLPWTAHAISQQTITVTTGTMQTHLSGGIFCPKTTQVTPGTVHITAQSTTFDHVVWSGTLKTHNPSLQVEITGTGQVTPAGTYGVA